MGWKSTIDISREEALLLIKARMYEATDEQLAYALDALGYGDDTELKYFGHNFGVGYIDEEE